MTKKDEVFKAIGRINIIYANLDFLITSTLNYLISDNSKAAGIVTSGITSLSAKLKLAEELCSVRNMDDSLKTELFEIFKEADKVRKRRNRFSHDILMMSDELLEDGKVKRYDVRQALKGGLGKSSEVIQIEELDEFADRLTQLVHKTIPTYNKVQNTLDTTETGA